MPTITCNQCGKEFKTRSTKVKFCSHKCYAESRKVINNFTCNFCGKIFHRRTNNDRRTKHIFCSKKCSDESKRKVFPKPCQYCGKIFTPINKKMSFCSRTCYESSRTNITIKTCIGCHKTFTVKTSIAHRYKYCSLECKRKNSGNIIKNCKRCGKPFVYKSCDIQRHLYRHYCSEECRRPPIIIKCANCGKEIRKVPSENRKFCCFACYRSFTGETSIETKMREALTRLGLTYIQEYGIGRYSIDFALVNQKIAIEADGNFWHDPIKDKRKDGTLNRYGWTVVRFTETEINNTTDLERLIVNKLNPFTQIDTASLYPTITFD